MGNVKLIFNTLKKLPAVVKPGILDPAMETILGDKKQTWIAEFWDSFLATVFYAGYTVYVHQVVVI